MKNTQPNKRISKDKQNLAEAIRIMRKMISEYYNQGDGGFRVYVSADDFIEKVKKESSK